MSNMSVADVKLISYIRRELLLSRDMLNEITRVLKSMDSVDKEDSRERLERIRSSKKDVETIQLDFLNYISKISKGMTHREDWLRVESKISNITDKLSGISYRLGFLLEKNWSVPRDILDKLTIISSTLDKMIQSLDTILVKTSEDPETALKSIKNLSKIESEIDFHYRDVLFTILDSNISQSSMLLLLNIAEMLEESSDILNNAANDLYIILFDLI